MKMDVSIKSENFGGASAFTCYYPIGWNLGKWGTVSPNFKRLYPWDSEVLLSGQNDPLGKPRNGNFKWLFSKLAFSLGSYAGD